MVGLLSSAGFTREALVGHARRMRSSSATRARGDMGIWVDERMGVGFGGQPMESVSRRFAIAFDGEIYNAGDLRREMESHGRTCRGTAAADVALAAFEQWGIDDATRRFDGAFALAVWDAARRELSLVRDRFGTKPLYVYHEPGLITFGSALKALFAGPSFDRSIDRGALASYLRYACVPAPKSIFRHAVKVRPAHVLTLSDPTQPLPASRPYWSLRLVAMEGLQDPFRGSEQDAIDTLDALLVRSVRLRSAAAQPLGALLSGGIDSSTVLALTQEAACRPVRSYTVGFADAAFNEAPHAARVAHHLGTDHSELTVTERDAHACVPRLAEIFDEPFGNPSQLPTLLVCQLASRSIAVAVCGDGGDELFGGYNRYVYGTRILPGVGRVPRAVRHSMATLIGSVPSTAWDRLSQATAVLMPNLAPARVGERIHKLGEVMCASSVDHMYRSLLSAWQHPDDVVATSPASDGFDPPTLDRREVPQLLDSMMLCDQLSYLPDDELTKMDRTSIAVGLDVRAPILDHRVVEFSWRLPRAMKLRGTIGKWILRQVLYRRVPREICARPKMGFSVPIDRWLRGPLHEWADDLLSPVELAKSGVFNPAAIAGAWADLQAGRRPAGAGLWAVIMFQAWRARWLS